MSNYMDEDNAGDFRDVPDEVYTEQQPTVQNPMSEVQAANSVPTRRTFPTTQTVDLPAQEKYEDEDETEDYTDVLSDARLRLEQGRLYELVMNSDLFVGSDCDPKAIKNVEKEIRNFARERMEIMLGMRQEPSQEKANSFPLELFPFNALEVEVLKSLASAATQGASKEAEPFMSGPQPPPKRNTLNPISVRGNQSRPVAPKQPAKPLPNKPATPVKRAQASEAVKRILEEEGVTLEEINEVFDPNHRFLSPDELARLTPEQMAERNRQSAARVSKTVPSRQSVPMPTDEHMEAIYSNRANQAAANPQMQMIMNLLDKKKN